MDDSFTRPNEYADDPFARTSDYSQQQPLSQSGTSTPLNPFRSTSHVASPAFRQDFMNGDLGSQTAVNGVHARGSPLMSLASAGRVQPSRENSVSYDPQFGYHRGSVGSIGSNLSSNLGSVSGLGGMTNMYGFPYQSYYSSYGSYTPYMQQPGMPAGMTAGMQPQAQQSVDPVVQNTFWQYIDLYGNQQGPFSAMQMSDWLPALADNIETKRLTDDTFISIGSWKSALQTNNIFIVRIPDDVYARALSLHNTSKGVNIPPGLQENAQQGTQDNIQESANQYQTAVEPAQSNINVGHSELNGSVPNPVPAAKPKPGTTEISEEGKNASKTAPATTPTPTTTTTTTSTPATTATSTISTTTATSTTSTTPVSPSKTTKTTKSKPAKLSVKRETPEKEIVEQPSIVDEVRKSISTLGIAPLPSKPAEKEPVVNHQPAPLPASDPWKKSTVVADKIDIELLRKKAKEADRQRTLKTKETFTTPPVSHTTLKPAPLPATVQGWSVKPVQPAKSLAEIQKEQQLQQQQKQQQQQQQARILSHAQPGQQQQHQTPQPVVGRPQQVKKPEPRYSTNTRTSTTAVSPSRQPVKSPRKIMSVTETAAQAKPTDELINWAKISFKDLAKEVDQMELLSLFLSLPSSKSAKEFIADSIYSYSRSLDGRRFAQDFLDRKKYAEKNMGAGDSWEKVMQRFNPDVEPQDPSFKVVTKKKSKPIKRPEGIF